MTKKYLRHINTPALLRCGENRRDNNCRGRGFDSTDDCCFRFIFITLLDLLYLFLFAMISLVLGQINLKEVKAMLILLLVLSFVVPSLLVVVFMICHVRVLRPKCTLAFLNFLLVKNHGNFANLILDVFFEAFPDQPLNVGECLFISLPYAQNYQVLPR